MYYGLLTPRFSISLPVLAFPGWSSHSEVVERAVVLAPVGLHADVQVEEDMGREEPLQLLARGGTDLLDHVAVASDHDRLLRFPLDDDAAVQAQDPLVAFRFLEPLHDDGARKRKLRVRELQHLLAD